MFNKSITAAASAARVIPKASKTSALPDLLETERLPCFATFNPAAAERSAVPVDRLKLLEPSPPVPTMSIVACSGSKETGIATSLMALAKPLTSSADSPLSLNAVNNAPAKGGATTPSANLVIKL